MNTTTADPATSSGLRERAESKAGSVSPASNPSTTPELTQRVLHELHVHQIELEMQNEELRHTQEALEASRARYFDLYDLAPVGYCTLDENNMILVTNLTVADLLGVTREELIQKPFTRFIFPEDQDVYYHLSKVSTAVSRPQKCELRLVVKNNDPMWMQLTMAVSSTADGSVERRIVLTDISMHKRLEEAQTFLLQCGYAGSNDDFFMSLARYLAKSLNMDYVCIDRLSGNALSAQTVAIYNSGTFDANVSYALKDTPCGDAVGKTICCFPAKVRQLFPHDAALRELNAESYIGTTLWSFDGKPIGLIAVIGRKPLKDPELAESMLKLVAIRAAGELERLEHEQELAEVKNEHDLESRLKHVDKMRLLGQLTSGVAHEVRNPLNGILNIMGALSKELSDSDRFNPYLEHMGNQVNRLTVLMEDLLVLGRPVHEENKEVVSAVTLFENAIETWLQTMLPSKPPVRFDRPDDPAVFMIRADRSSLTQLFVNLLENASNHSPAGSEIVCSIQGPYANNMVFSVKDRGAGISEEVLPRIFDPFFTTRKGGTGLGLSIVRAIAENHQGNIVAFNNMDGAGATFKVVIPLCVSRIAPDE